MKKELKRYQPDINGKIQAVPDGRWMEASDVLPELARLRAALRFIRDIAGTEANEWDAAKRVIPAMADAASAALKDAS